MVIALVRELQGIPLEVKTMLWTLVLVLLVLWALGLATSYTLGGLLHVLLVVALIAAVFQLVSGRRVA